MGKRYCVFAAYNKENKVEKELVFYLEELNKIVDRIVFVMDNPLNDKEKKIIETMEEKLTGIILDNEMKEIENEYSRNTGFKMGTPSVQGLIGYGVDTAKGLWNNASKNSAQYYSPY